MSRYSNHREECPTCHERYFAELGYDGEVSSEREEIECQCGGETFCQSCIEEKAACARPGCKAVFCSDECASGSNLDGEPYCAAHVPLPKAEDPIERFTVALERFVSGREAA